MVCSVDSDKNLSERPFLLNLLLEIFVPERSSDIVGSYVVSK